MAKQSKRRGGGFQPSPAYLVANGDAFSLDLSTYGSVTVDWNLSQVAGLETDVLVWVWVSKSDGPFERIQPLPGAYPFVAVECTDIEDYLLGGGQTVQAYAEARSPSGELLMRSSVYSGTYAPS